MRSIVALLLVALAACESSVEPEPDRFLGHVSDSHETIVLPDEVVAGEPFTLTILTRGLDSCWRNAGETLETDGNSATVSVYDKIVPDGCFTLIISINHEVPLRFDEPGTAEVRIRGRGDEGPVTIVRSVQVLSSSEDAA